MNEIERARRESEKLVKPLHESLLVHKSSGSTVPLEGHFKAQSRTLYIFLEDADKVSRGDRIERKVQPGQLWEVNDVDVELIRAVVILNKLSNNGQVIASSKASSKASSVTINNPQFGGGFANVVHGNQTGGTINNISETPSLAGAATEIQNLLKTLEASNPQANETEQTAFLTAMIPPTQRQRFISAFQSAGSAAIDEIPYGPVFKALVNGWRNPNT